MTFHSLCTHSAQLVLVDLALCLPVVCTAQAAVTDPNAVVPPVVYQSVFADAPKGVETQSTDWKKANADVAQFPRGHVDILKWEEAQIKAKPMAKPAATSPVQPAAATSPQPPAAPTVPGSPGSPATHKH